MGFMKDYESYNMKVFTCDKCNNPSHDTIRLLHLPMIDITQLSKCDLSKLFRVCLEEMDKRNMFK